MLKTSRRSACVSPCSLGTKRVLDERVERILQTIESASAYDLTQLARIAGLSNSRLSHLFKQETGLDLRSFLTHYRLEKAAELLQDAGMPVKEVSYIVGYRHSASFARAFHRKFGCAPKHYRNAVDPLPQIADSANSI